MLEQFLDHFVSDSVHQGDTQQRKVSLLLVTIELLCYFARTYIILNQKYFIFLFLCLRVEIKSKFQCFRFPNSYKYRITILNVCIIFNCGIKQRINIVIGEMISQKETLVTKCTIDGKADVINLFLGYLLCYLLIAIIIFCSVIWLAHRMKLNFDTGRYSCHGSILTSHPSSSLSNAKTQNTHWYVPFHSGVLKST